MIQDFADSWVLFHYAYLSGWLVAVLLGMLGVVVVARDQIFLGAAAAQASSLGIALTIGLGAVLAHDRHGESPTAHAAAVLAAVVFAALAALVTSRRRGRRDSAESLTGWVFLFASSVALLIVARSPLGLDEIQRLLASSIIGADGVDVVGFALVTALTAVWVWRWRDPLILLVVDSEMAAAVGMRVVWWERGVAVWVGASIGAAIHTSGLLYTFGCLVLPAMAARYLCREIRPMLWVAPLISVGCAVVGFVVANDADLPPAQAAVALMCVVVAACGLVRR